MRVVIAGTGTGVGKTHVSCALLRRLRARGARVIGLKPIETGLDSGLVTDQSRLLRAASSAGDPGSAFHVKQAPAGGRPDEPFHVQPSPYGFGPAIAPHLAAWGAGQRIDIGLVRSWVIKAQQLNECAAIIETAGGLFTPLAPGTTNLDLAFALEPVLVLLVAPDRLGVLHEITATLGLATARGRPVDAVTLSAPTNPDGSTGRNSTEIQKLGLGPIKAVFPRSSETSPATQEAADLLARWLDPALTQRADLGPT